MIGTVAYMSPEQLRGKPVDHRSDIFSFGAILYEMLTGCRAFRGETEVDTMTAVLREEPNRAHLEESAIPAGYQDIVKHCLEKEPENRFQSAKDLAFRFADSLGVFVAQERPSRPRHQTSLPALPWTLVGVAGGGHGGFSGHSASAHSGSSSGLSPLDVRSRNGIFGALCARWAVDCLQRRMERQPVQLFSTVGNSLLAQPLNLSDASLLAVSRNNELAVVLHGTHNGQLETVGRNAGSAPLAGGSPKELLADVRWADWDAQGESSSRQLCRRS